ncbi:3-deoxy-D-manno-octulosonic-acid transferase [Ectothiorhodosinus mongolicus]|uniref:3-deoxy-D-manno-octulosonic acid transferase n=1 Tax=Ectothiorhodosinus mongolicus TaxID=233100 RepID=A0A1R3VTI2_9GAMM|nr:lipid IV(A) 3-deoxy-D-manno-octulosonic acid transferase [Ectothiorhodosinus mongolicus]ULX56728.1 3-deoxy-D-manno-octulosonic acid transferase [Ectothiorhodosinus mongolicus]SIT67018.1 3-deoxy-D-manno-octulosonic-acid transferase [Ectothiorhodosinus mongolicus]
MALKLYSLLLYVLTPWVLLRLYWRGRVNPAYRQRIAERFGYVPRYDSASHGRLWVHAVSVGEVMAAVPLIRAHMASHSELEVIVTTTTPTGAAELERQLGDEVQHHYLPYDLPGAVRRFLERVQPDQLWVMETEIWPNLLIACYQREVRVFLLNARLSPRSFRRYCRFSALLRPVLAAVSGIAARDESDRQAFIGLGVDPAAVKVTGNIKFDLAIDPNLREAALELRDQLGARPIWIAASTHGGEEAVVIAAHQAVLMEMPDALLVWVPRHPERFEDAAQSLDEAGLSYVSRSAHANPTSEHQAWLIDSMGELLLMYGIADAAFIGGSLVSAGGHNPLEAAAQQVPIITGPDIADFESIYAALEARGGAKKVADSEALAGSLLWLLANQVARLEMITAAKEVLKANRGAVDRILSFVASRA